MLRSHAGIEDYRSWVGEFVPNQAVRWARMCAYRGFVQAWPDINDWFAAPLPVRLGFTGGALRADGRTVAHRANGYLMYLALVRGVGLDYGFLLGRKYNRMFSEEGGRGLGFDLGLFDRHVDRMVQLGFSRPSASTDLMEPGQVGVAPGRPRPDGDHRGRPPHPW